MSLAQLTALDNGQFLAGPHVRRQPAAPAACWAIRTSRAFRRAMPFFDVPNCRAKPLHDSLFPK